MKLLVVSNYFPPYYFGGYELGCQDIVERLKAAGHAVTVVTSTYGVRSKVSEDGGVLRSLSLNADAGARSRADRLARIRDLLAFRRALKKVAPDLVYFWNLSGLCLQIVAMARSLGWPCVFFLSDTSFVAWRTGAHLRKCVMHPARSPLKALFQKLLQRLFGGTRFLQGSPVIEGMPCHFASTFLAKVAQRDGILPAPNRQRIIHWGVDPELFHPDDLTRRWPPERFLLVGQIIPEKGVQTAIESFRLLFADKANPSLTLSIAGGSSNPAYEAGLHDFVRRHGLAAHVHFLGKLPRTEMPRLYARHDVLLFPSEWEEPFAITPLEAMACGLPVIGTATGGSREIFVHEETALIFEVGNANSCAAAVQRLRTDHALFEKLAGNALAMVHSHFTIARMAQKIEQDLSSLIRWNERSANDC